MKPKALQTDEPDHDRIKFKSARCPDRQQIVRASLQHLIIAGCFLLAEDGAWAATTNRSAAGIRTSTTREQTETVRQQAVVPVAPDRATSEIVADNVRQLLLEAETLRTRFLEQRTETLKQIREATESDREQLRQRLRAAQASFLDAQTALREKIQEVRARTVELKQELKDHTAVVDAAKEQARDRVRERRTGTD